MHNTASELSNDLLQTYFDEYEDSHYAKKVKWAPNIIPLYLTLDEFDYSEWYKELNDSLPLEGDEEKYYSVPSTPLSKGDKKERNELKMLTPNKLLALLPILLAQIKAGNSTNKLKNEIRQKIFCISITKSQKH